MKRLIKLFTLAVGILCSIHSVHAQYPSYQQALLNERVGFGRNATGGAGGEVYWVTNTNDGGLGSLRQACEQDDNPRWILFAVNGTIDQGVPIQVRSNKTIDGRGASITLTRYGLWIGMYDNNNVFNGSRNVIVENINFSNGTTTGTVLNALMIHQGAGDVWVDHCTFTNWPLTSTLTVTTARPSPAPYSDVTISWCRFAYTPGGFNTPILVTHNPQEENGERIRITVHHNYFDRQKQRSPMVRRAKVHCFNNYLYNWEIYGMSSYYYAQLYTQNNIFYAGSGDKRGVTFSPNQYELISGYAKNEGNWLINGATTPNNNAGAVFNPASSCSDGNCYPYTAETANPTLQSNILASAGATRSPGLLANMSTRANVQSGQGNLISGFTISGSPSDSKRVIIRAIGPSLLPWFPNAMGNPTLTVYNVYGQQIQFNDNWQDDPAQAAEIQGTGVPPSHNLEAAWVGYLSPGTYSAAINGWDTGIGVLEIYDLNKTAPSKLVNISSRATVDPNNPTIAGFIAQSGWTKLLIRGIGPSLAQFGIQNPISDPTLTMNDANGTQIAYNNNWQDAPSGVSQLGFAPSDWREAVIVTNLAPGTYTVTLRDYYNNWGIGSIEMYKF